jgi:hypothetical protein
MVIVEFSPKNLLAVAKRSFAGIAVFATIAALGSCAAGCQPAKSAADVEAEYTAKIMACSAGAQTLAQAKACRRAVNESYGLCESAQWPRITPCDE